MVGKPGMGQIKSNGPCDSPLERGRRGVLTDMPVNTPLPADRQARHNTSGRTPSLKRGVK